MRSLVLASLVLFAIAAAAQMTQTPQSPDQIPKQPTQPAATTPATPTITTPANLAGTPENGGGSTDTDISLMDVPPMPKGKATLIGGTVRKIDRIRDRVQVQPFGGHTMTIGFDERTHIYRDGVETTQLGIHPGDRVYVDTLLDKTHILAKNIRVVTSLQPANANGQVIAYNPRTGTLDMRDRLSTQPVRFQVGPNTIIKRLDQPGSVADLQPNALAVIHFAPGAANRGVATEVDIVAPPGQAFQFAGTITHLDMRTDIISIHNRTDDKTYDISFSPALFRDTPLAIGKEASIVAVFEGTGYRAKTIQLVEAPQSNPDAYKDQNSDQKDENQPPQR
jgi:hypothetical protein